MDNEQKDFAEPKWKKIMDLTANAVVMNFLFLLCCLPVVTMGQAWCGLLSGIRYTIRGESWFAGFKEGFRTRFLRGVIGWTVSAAAVIYIGVSLYFNIGYFYLPVVIFQGIFLVIAMMLTAALVFLNVYIPGTVGDWVANAASLCFGAPWQVALTGILMWMPMFSVLCMLFDAIFFVIFVVMFIIVYFAAAGLIGTIVLKAPLTRIKNQMEDQGVET